VKNALCLVAAMLGSVLLVYALWRAYKVDIP